MKAKIIEVGEEMTYVMGPYFFLDTRCVAKGHVMSKLGRLLMFLGRT